MWVVTPTQAVRQSKEACAVPMTRHTMAWGRQDPWLALNDCQVVAESKHVQCMGVSCDKGLRALPGAQHLQASRVGTHCNSLKIFQSVTADSPCGIDQDAHLYVWFPQACTCLRRQRQLCPLYAETLGRLATTNSYPQSSHWAMYSNIPQVRLMQPDNPVMERSM